MNNRYGCYGVMGLLSLFPLWVACTIPWDLNDDAYITLNYARNLAEGRGFVYNHGPASLGTTTPLLTLIMAGFHWLVPSVRLDVAALIFSALCWASLPWLLVLCRRSWHLTGVEAFSVSSVLVLFGNYYGLGMEAYLFGAILLGTSTLVLAGRYGWAGVAMGLLVLTRGEGILLAPVVVVMLVGRGLRLRGGGVRSALGPIARLGVGGAVVVLPWMAYAFVTFGRVLPDTLGAKLAQSALGAPGFGAQMLIRVTEWGSYLPGAPWLTWVYHAVALLGLWRMVRRSHPLLLPVVWAVSYGEAYVLLGVPYYWWYELPLYNAWLLCVAMGLACIYAWAGQKGREGSRVGALVVGVVVVCMCAQTVVWARSTAGYPKAQTYRDASDWIATNASPDATIATGEVGYLGYYLPNPVIDLAGLTSPEYIDVIRANEREKLLWISLPDYYVALDQEQPWMAVHESPEFRTTFEEVAAFPAPLPWGRCLIFKRRLPGTEGTDGEGGGRDRLPLKTEHPGRWNRSETDAPDTLSDDQRAAMEALDAIGYLSGSTAASTQTGVVFWDESRAAEGCNLYTSGHDTGATLMSMSGEVLYTWSHAFDPTWKIDGKSVRADHPGLPFWRRAYLLPEGEILVVFEGLGLVCLDRNSQVRWVQLNRAHHAVDVQASGALYTLSFAARMIPELHGTMPIRDDYVTVLNRSGEELRRVSLWACFMGSSFESLVHDRRQRHGDIFHTNSIYVVRGDEGVRHPEFTAGRVLVSLCYLDTIALLDLDEERVVWAQQGPYRYQHDAKLLEGGSLLLFDNNGLGGASRVLEFGVEEMALRWQYPKDSARTLYSPTCSTAYRLANGNTLMTESDNGRALEVTSAGELVWEFLNPNRAGEEGEFVATLFDVQRIPMSKIKGWLVIQGRDTLE